MPLSIAYGVKNTLAFHAKIIYVLSTDSNLVKIVTLGVTNRHGAIWDLEANVKQWPCKSKTGSRPKSVLSLLMLTLLIPLIIVVTFMMQQNHLLMTLLALEGITLSLVLTIPLTLTINLIPVSATCVIMLSIGACEARLGLALIVAASRYTGNDILSAISMNKC